MDGIDKKNQVEEISLQEDKEEEVIIEEKEEEELKFEDFEQKPVDLVAPQENKEEKKETSLEAAPQDDSESSDESKEKEEISEAEEVDEREESESEKKALREYSIEKIIPDFVDNSRRKAKERQFLSLLAEEELFDSQSAAEKLSRDHEFFLKFKRYTHVNHFIHAQQPFTYIYEKQYWDLTFFDRMYFSLRKKCSPFNSAPFKPSGECAFFEFETLNSPQRCSAYVARSRDLSTKYIKKYSKALAFSSADVFEEMLIEDIDTDDSDLNVSRFVFGDKKVGDFSETGEVDNVPDKTPDRHAWPENIAENKEKASSDDQK